MKQRLQNNAVRRSLKESQLARMILAEWLEKGPLALIWTSTKDKMPQNNQEVIYYVPSSGRIIGGYYDADQKCFIEGVTGHMGFDENDVTHWTAQEVE
jgi:hypothetical protein